MQSWLPAEYPRRNNNIIIPSLVQQWWMHDFHEQTIIDPFHACMGTGWNSSSRIARKQSTHDHTTECMPHLSLFSTQNNIMAQKQFVKKNFTEFQSMLGFHSSYIMHGNFKQCHIASLSYNGNFHGIKFGCIIYYWCTYNILEDTGAKNPVQKIAS